MEARKNFKKKNKLLQSAMVSATSFETLPQVQPVIEKTHKRVSSGFPIVGNHFQSIIGPQKKGVPLINKIRKISAKIGL